MISKSHTACMFTHYKSSVKSTHKGLGRAETSSRHSSYASLYSSCGLIMITQVGLFEPAEAPKSWIEKKHTHTHTLRTISKHKVLKVLQYQEFTKCICGSQRGHIQMDISVKIQKCQTLVQNTTANIHHSPLQMECRRRADFCLRT